MFSLFPAFLLKEAFSIAKAVGIWRQDYLYQLAYGKTGLVIHCFV